MRSDEMRNGGGDAKDRGDGRRDGETENDGGMGRRRGGQRDGEADEQTSFSTSLKFWEDCRQQRL